MKEMREPEPLVHVSASFLLYELVTMTVTKKGGNCTASLLRSDMRMSEEIVGV